MMPVLSLLARLSMTDCCRSVRSLTSTSGPLLFRATPMLSAEPMKKKKKIDLTIIVSRETKRKKKLEKMIKQQEKKGQKLKPIDEIEGDRNILKTLNKRKRAKIELSFEETERRSLLHKDWVRYKTQQFASEMKSVQLAIDRQTLALMELRVESEQLYQQAIELDDQLFPYEVSGPLETPPIKGYIATDGEFVDTTRKFDK